MMAKPNMLELLDPLAQSFDAPALVDVAPHVESSAYGIYASLLSRELTSGTVVCVAPNQRDAERIYEDAITYLGEKHCSYFPHWETLPFERVSPTIETQGRRLRVREMLLRGETSRGHLVVTTIRAMCQRLAPADTSLSIELVPNMDLDQEQLTRTLAEWGYVREYQTENRGEFSVRGSIVDVFPSVGTWPVRIDFFGDVIESIQRFDPESQRSVEILDELLLFPARELALSEGVRERARVLVDEHPPVAQALSRIAHGEYFDGLESWLPWVVDEEIVLGDLLRLGDMVLLCDPARLRSRAMDMIDEEDSLASSLGATWGLEAGAIEPRLHVGFERALRDSRASHVLVGGNSAGRVGFGSWELNGREPEQLIAKVRNLSEDGIRVAVAAETEFSATMIRKSFREAGIPVDQDSQKSVVVLAGDGLIDGWIGWPLRLAVLSESDLSGRRRAHRISRTRTARRSVEFESLEVGGYVVHETHGVARYQGMTKRAMGGVERDYLLLEYRGGDKIYVPSDQLALITPYGGGETPALSRLGGSDWSATKARAKKAAQEVAQELIVLYQKRTVSPGHAFSPDSPWQQEMESLFPFELTPDQERAIQEVKADMESPRPMDRLVCGDVGFGKTEIALRAAFKAVQDGKQVAVLVPTTLLASQHYQTFSDRFAGQPVRVEMLSRFLTTAQAKSVLSGLESGSVDIVVGTHRLLGAEQSFANLGLLVVDEEQRFGVAHKEAIKSLSAGVDVLTLSATPIPRTLEMSLTGIRDLSLLHTAPAQRHPILTHVGEYDELAISEAIRRELLRDGQVFFVHNRVKDIEAAAERIRDLVPEARVAIAHGQMDEGTLEQVVLDFWEQRYDVLVCTTIIESGIDMPTVNTLVVDRADRLGLGQLHQLRGRVGRSGLRAYAYLFFPPEAALSEEAFERLRTIGENTELGSGYRIAMRDLEIRGAGNLLGMRQSGQFAAVGYDMYVRLVQEAVAELKGESLPVALPQVTIDLPVSASIPESYIGREDLRLDTYRRLSTVASLGELDDLVAELEDRFGSLPAPVAALGDIVRLRVLAVSLGLKELVAKRIPSGAGLVVSMSPVELAASKRMKLRRLHPRAVLREGTHELEVPLPRGAEPVSFVRSILTELFDVAEVNAD
jgi:transcription-repair coupling factor (superfamily II helicase)